MNKLSWSRKDDLWINYLDPEWINKWMCYLDPGWINKRINEWMNYLDPGWQSKASLRAGQYSGWDGKSFCN